MILFTCLWLLLSSQPSGALTIEATPLKRNQLPDGFPLQVQDVGFAVIQVRLLNQSGQVREFDPQALKVFSPKKKELKRASPEDITPKLMKFYIKTRRGVHGEAYGGRQPAPRELERVPVVDPNRAPGTVSADQGQRLRRLLEDFELAASFIQPGQEQQGLVYVKSKKTGAQLYGGSVRLEDGTSAPLK